MGMTTTTPFRWEMDLWQDSTVGLVFTFATKRTLVQGSRWGIRCQRKQQLKNTRRKQMNVFFIGILPNYWAKVGKTGDVDKFLHLRKYSSARNWEYQIEAT